MMKSIKTWIFVGFASLLLVACGQGGGGAGSKKSKTLENTKKAGFPKENICFADTPIVKPKENQHFQ